MAVSDHGLEVLRKSALEYLGNPNELKLRMSLVDGSITVESSPFAPPSGTDYIGRSVSGSVETYEYRAGGSGGTLLKTIEVTYTSPSLSDLVSVEIV